MAFICFFPPAIIFQELSKNYTDKIIKIHHYVNSILILFHITNVFYFIHPSIYMFFFLILCQLLKFLIQLELYSLKKKLYPFKNCLKTFQQDSKYLEYIVINLKPRNI